MATRATLGGASRGLRVRQGRTRRVTKREEKYSIGVRRALGTRGRVGEGEIAWLTELALKSLRRMGQGKLRLGLGKELGVLLGLERARAVRNLPS